MAARYITKAALAELEARLTERDEAVIRRVSALRFATGAQLARLHFPDTEPQASARAARRALLRLTSLDVLARLPRAVGGIHSGSAGFVYCLGLAGQRLAIERGWQSKRRGRRSHVPGTLFLAHALKVSELHTLVVEADRSGRLDLLALDAEPACWRTYGEAGGQRRELKPDSYVRLGAGEFEDSWFIEIDMGSEGTRAVDTKLGQYAAYAAADTEQAVIPKALWLVPGAQRAAVIRACVARLPSAERGLFQTALFSHAIPLLAGSGAGGGLPDHEKIEVMSQGDT